MQKEYSYKSFAFRISTSSVKYSRLLELLENTPKRDRSSLIVDLLASALDEGNSIHSDVILDKKFESLEHRLNIIEKKLQENESINQSDSSVETTKQVENTTNISHEQKTKPNIFQETVVVNSDNNDIIDNDTIPADVMNFINNLA